MKRLTFSIIALSALLSTCGAQTFVTPNGSTIGTKPVNAEADFTAGNGTLTIDLSNLLAASGVQDVTQNLSAISFTFNGSGFGASSINSSFATLATVNNGGSVTQNGTTTSVGWVLSGGAGTYSLDVLSGSGHAGPAHTLIGGVEGSTTAYASANGSIAGNGPHNAFAQGEADWTLSIAGVTPQSTVSSVTFQFGTTDGSNLITVPAPAPEPFSILGLALGSALLLRRRAARR
ncbi:MAG TPA: hypothetical protein VKT78_04895 [Fimbriimonadaceae bacterium]|nr:hypothetical protein [Fimbriimonadaceae bacterium]